MFLYLSHNFYSLKKNILGQSIFLKRIIIAIVGFITHKSFRSKNFKIIGSQNLMIFLIIMYYLLVIIRHIFMML